MFRQHETYICSACVCLFVTFRIFHPEKLLVDIRRNTHKFTDPYEWMESADSTWVYLAEPNTFAFLRCPELSPFYVTFLRFVMGNSAEYDVLDSRLAYNIYHHLIMTDK